MTDTVFEARLPLLPHDFTPFQPFPKYNNRKLWQNAANARLYIQRGEKALACGAFAAISAADYMRFSADGNRVDFETVYFEKRRRLTDLVMAECCEGKGRFSSRIIDGVWSICEESAWQLPAHNAYVRDTTQLLLPDVTRPVLDLFACETAALLAAVYYLFEGCLGNAGEFIEKRILHELKIRLVTPYLTQQFWWMGNGDEQMNNWTAWCTQNVLITMFLTPQEKELQKKAVTKAAYSLDCFLKDYGEDGCCNEGAQYYRHAGLCLFGAAQVLSKTAPVAFESIWSLPKIKNIAEYILNMHVSDKYYINFADCSPVAGRCSVREFLFAQAVKSEALAAFAAADCRINHQPEGDIARINLYYVLQEAFNLKEAQAYCLPQPMPKDIYYSSVGVFVSHCSKFCLAAKAGGNADSHNHNDTGSVTVYKNGLPFIIDIGVESYCKKTFSPLRYEIWTMQSLWHNVVNFDNAQQLAGAEYCAKNVNTAFDETESTISMSLKAAYDKAARLTEYSRSVKHIKEKEIIICDECRGGFEKAVLTLMLLNKPCINGSHVTVENSGEICFEGAKSITSSEISITDARLLTAWPEKLYCLHIEFNSRLLTKII